MLVNLISLLSIIKRCVEMLSLRNVYYICLKFRKHDNVKKNKNKRRQIEFCQKSINILFTIEPLTDLIRGFNF